MGAGLRVGAKCPARAAPTQHHGWVPGPLLGFGAPDPVGNRPCEKPAPVRQDLNLSGSALKAIRLLRSGESNLLGNAAWQECMVRISVQPRAEAWFILRKEVPIEWQLSKD